MGRKPRSELGKDKKKISCSRQKQAEPVRLVLPKGSFLTILFIFDKPARPLSFPFLV